MKRNWLDVISLILIIIGGINWGLVGFFGVDVIGMMFGDSSAVTRTIFVLVGLAAIYSLVLFWKLRTDED